MGCGTSRTVQLVEEEAHNNLKIAPDERPNVVDPHVATEELTSVHSNTPDHDSKPVENPLIQSNGTTDTPVPPARPIEENLPQTPDDLQTPPTSAGNRGVAFEVGSPPGNGESLIRRHPPKKFQKLEDQQQGDLLTQEKLQEKQATAERRRQEILTQRVQSAKQRSARSAGRMRVHPTDADEVEQFMRNEELDWISLVRASLLPPVKPKTQPEAPSEPPSSLYLAQELSSTG